MERAQRGVKRAQPDTPATGMDRAQRRGRGVNPSRDGAGTAQTPASGRAVCAVPASAGRLGVEGTTEEMGAGACTQTPGAPAAGRGAAATRQRDKCALPHGDPAVPLMAPLTPALAPSTHPLLPRLPCRMGNQVLLWTGRRCRSHLCALWCGWMSSGRRHLKTWRVAPPETRQRPGLPRQATAFVSVSCVRARQTPSTGTRIGPSVRVSHAN
jgi:hypothetical protein